MTTGKPGDRILIDSARVGEHRREGVILRVIDSPLGTRYEVRWEDGHETTLRPTAGSARVVAASAPAPSASGH